MKVAMLVFTKWIRNYIDKKYEERGLPYPTGADFD